MDWQSVCIIDNKGDKDITEKVLSIKKDSASSRYRIVFRDSKKEFYYSLDRITYLDAPKEIDISKSLIFENGKFKPEVKKILRFGGWCKIQYLDNEIAFVKLSDLQFISDRKSDTGISEILKYLIEIATVDDNGASAENYGSEFLTNQLKAVVVREDSVLASFLFDDIRVKTSNDIKPIIAPFQSNRSQIEAIQKALNYKISVIQGPPGTGKTQTILNIIANLLVQGKTIAVVSGNNEATRNVYEKMKEEKLESMCALLGNKANIRDFFNSQPSKEVLKEVLKNYDSCLSNTDMLRLGEIVIESYDSITEKAQLTTLKEELLVEARKNDVFLDITKKNKDVKVPQKFSGSSSSENDLRNAAFIEALYSAESLTLAKKLKMLFNFGFWPRRNFDSSKVIDYLQNRYYKERIEEINEKLSRIENAYPKDKINRILGIYYKESLKYLLCFLKKNNNLTDKTFELSSYKNDETFIKHYPIVLSTTYSLQYCKPKGILFDYVIIDESSQVNLTSAVIALSCARNAVIVGDSNQLQHVVSEKFKAPLDKIRSKYILPDFIDYRRFSILESVLRKYGAEIPSTLLNEHYRCDPEIIGFCNKRFYENKLVIQTKHAKDCGITIIETPSHSAIGRTNERQVEIINKEILPRERNLGEIGIVAPYRDQVSLIKKHIHSNDILVDTVHKFQGKERSTMILSTTSDRTVISEDFEYVDFLNNPNLINVAISRAKKKLYVIASKEALEQKGTLLCDLSNYVYYYAKDSKKEQSQTYSVFDLMYNDYAPILREMKKKLLRVSEFSSENIVATIIEEICKSNKYGLISYKFNYPLRKIINVNLLSNLEDYNFAMRSGSHCDFVIYNQLNKQIRLAIEVDGKQHEEDLQKKRDSRKDRILNSVGICLLRIKTTDLNIKEKIESKLEYQVK